MVRIKMCGITNPGDAAAAADAGASSIGIIAFENSPRYVHPARLTEIRSVLPPWVSITVVAPDAEIAARYDADVWQLYSLPVGVTNKPIIQAIRVGADLDVTDVLYNYGSSIALLFDAYHPDLMGGSGHRISESLAARLFSAPCQVPRILAGGLTPDNVAEAISTFTPWGVDVSSGIELSPGIKCPSKMKAFASAVMTANTL